MTARLLSLAKHCKLVAVAMRRFHPTHRSWPVLLSFALFCFSACHPRSEYFGKVEPPPGNVFRFNNESEPEYVDPGLMSGQPDGRIAALVFEGLTVTDWKALQHLPGAAERWEISPDQQTYTFYLRKNATWSDGHPLNAHDFVYSWTRVLDPKTASVYASHLYHIINGKEFNTGQIKDPSLLGLRAVDDYTLEVRLREPVPYFLFLTAFHTLMPVPAHVVEKYGMHWTDVAHIVGNGPFLMVEHRTNAKFEFVRNPCYWDKARVRLERVIAYSIDQVSTSANMYEAGMVDWVPSNDIPPEYIPYMRGRFRDMRSLPFLSIYYYAINVTRPPLNNRLVRRALSMAIDRKAITDDLLRGGQIPGAHFVPVGFPNYQSPAGPEFNPQEAARLLAQAGYPNGQGFPTLEISFNTLESHKKIAEAIQQMWARYLNIQVTVHNQEWATFLKKRRSQDYDVARDGWIGDYPDPMTFMELLESTNGNNDPGWKNPEYDRLLALARMETDSERRMNLFYRGEQILLDDSPVLPIYTYASNTLIKPYVMGFQASPMDEYPIDKLWIDYQWREHLNHQSGEK